MSDTIIYKILPEADWESAKVQGTFRGATVDLADGYIHFSTGLQLLETARRHFRGQTGLVVVAFDANDFGERIKWEPSRGGDLFPHLYDMLDPGKALWCAPMPLDEDGIPILPEQLDLC